MELKEKLVALRKKKGLSQLEVAEKMNISRQAISRWETGAAVPSAENLKYLGNLYNVSLDYLFNDGVVEIGGNKEITETLESEISLERSQTEPKKYDKTKIKWVVTVLCLFALIVSLYICVIIGNGGDFVPINEIHRREVEAEVESGFDFEW